MDKSPVSRRLLLAVVIAVLFLAGTTGMRPAQASSSGYLNFKVYVCSMAAPTTCTIVSNYTGWLPQGHFYQPAGINPVRYYEVLIIGGQNSTITYKTLTLDGKWASYAFGSTRTCSPTILCTYLDFM